LEGEVTEAGSGIARWDASVYTMADADLDELSSSLLSRCRAFADRYQGALYSLAAAEIAVALQELGELCSRALYLDGTTAAGAAVASGDASRIDHRARVEATMETMDELVQFAELEWLDLPDDSAEALLTDAALDEYRHFLEVVRSVTAYTLPEAAESALAIREPAANTAWVFLHNQITRALRPAVRGERQSLEDARRWLECDDAELRADALTAIYDALEPVAGTLAQCLDTLVADKLSIDEIRGLPHARAEQDLTNELPSQIVDDMLGIAEQNYAVTQRWFTRKAQLLGVDRLRFEDMRAPIGPMPPIPYDRAVQAVTETFDSFAGWAGELVREMISRGHIDADPRPDKHGGAICRSHGPGKLPSVLLSYFGTVEDVVCLAHELGHALHFTIAGRRHDGLTFDAPLPINEVAAAFTELLLYDRLIERENDSRIRQLLVAKRVESNLEAIFLPTFVNRFEARAHELRAEGSVLTDARIRQLWTECSLPFYGPDVQLPDRWGLHWSLIPHLVHERFYCYAYIFARLVGLNLYAMYTHDRHGFTERFRQLLSCGGSASPVEQFALAGVDVTDTGCWHTAIAEVAAMLSPLLG
jgi:oligoendopeptidase F